jgi:hypothetical protein
MQKSHVMRELFCFIAPYIVPYPAGKCQARGAGGQGERFDLIRIALYISDKRMYNVANDKSQFAGNLAIGVWKAVTEYEKRRV